VRKITVSSMDGTNGSSMLVFADQLGIIARVLREDAARKRETYTRLMDTDEDGYGFDKRAKESDEMAAFFEESMGYSIQTLGTLVQP